MAGDSTVADIPDSSFLHWQVLANKAVMSPRRSQSVDRRRRVLVDESRNDEVSSRPSIFRGDSSGPATRYNHAALDAINAPIARYVPLRPYWLLIWFLVGLVPVFGLLLLDRKLHVIESVVGTAAARAFDLQADGNLMTWLSSVLFGFAVAVMLGTYSVRRFRRDDYRGRFTIWRWAIVAAVLLSVDSTTRLHEVWQALCNRFVGTVWGDGSIWWIGVYAVAFGGLLIRLIFEMSSSRVAVGSAIAAGAAYLGAATFELNVLNGFSEETASTSKLAAVMLGHHWLLFALVSYAREVVLEAMGLVESPSARRARAEAGKLARAKKKQETAANETENAAPAEKPKRSRRKSRTTPEPDSTQAAPPAAEEADPSTRSTLRAVSPDPEELDQPVDDSDSAREKVKPKLKAVRAEDDHEDEFPEERKLSKAERRRLRKEQKRQQRKAGLIQRLIARGGLREHLLSNQSIASLV